MLKERDASKMGRRKFIYLQILVWKYSVSEGKLFVFPFNEKP